MTLRLLFVAWMATLGADRIDLLGGRGPALLLPFHVLTPLLLVALWGPRLARGEWPTLPPALQRYGAWLLALLSLLCLSLLRSADLAISAGRLVLLAATIIGVALVIWGLRGRGDADALVQRGARVGLLFSALFNLVTLLALLGVLPSTLELGLPSINLEPLLYGVIPRLAGPTLDMNRGAMLVLVFGALIAAAPRGARTQHPNTTRYGTTTPGGQTLWLTLAALMLLGSLSRSAVLAALVMLGVAAAKHLIVTPSNNPQPPAALGMLTPRTKLVAAALLALLAIGAGALLDPALRERSAATVEPLTERFDLREGSAQTHALLLERGVEVGTRSLPHALFGIGFGTSFRELADVFGGNPYGNYHSAWLQLWVEAGVLAMLVALAATLLPLRRRTRLAGLLVGLFVYNVFYIGIGEPQFWLATGLAWLESGA